jgi:hypothetical protein
MGYSSFTEYYGKMFMDKLEEVYQTELQDPDFLKREDYPDCKSRAQAGVDIAVKPVVTTMGYSFCLDAEKRHGENTMEEQSVLLNAGADPAVVDEVEGFWNG